MNIDLKKFDISLNEKKKHDEQHFEQIWSIFHDFTNEIFHDRNCDRQNFHKNKKFFDFLQIDFQKIKKISNFVFENILFVFNIFRHFWFVFRFKKHIFFCFKTVSLSDFIKHTIVIFLISMTFFDFFYIWFLNIFFSFLTCFCYLFFQK